ncbi:MAG: DUF2062 domain-containing protein [Ferruginibacter sp.]
MTVAESVRDDFDKLKACVIIPTFNNAATLGKVIEEVATFTNHIIVVNDGSMDETLSVTKKFPFIRLVSYSKNVGKGWALRKGFAEANALNYSFAITIDSDGQHFASDLPAFIDKLKQQRDAIIIGARNMGQASVPGKSSFGHKFSNFWFKVETGINCPDTQSGYRLYPVWLLKDMRFFTRKYEFEIEVLVRAAWKGVKIESVPVTVYYAPKEERISHFRPFKDFTRISILNTFLVLITFLYIKPIGFIKSLFEKKKLKQLLHDHLLHSPHTDQNKAISVAFGIFMGIVPLWGLQLVIAIFLAVVFKLNKVLVIIAANISIPPMIPIIIYLSYKTGALWMGTDAGNLEFSRSITLQSIQKNLQQYIYGAVTMAILAGIIAGIICFILLKIFKRKQLITG